MTATSRVGVIAGLESGKGLNGFASFLLGTADIIKTLQVEPKLRAGAKEMPEAQSRVAGDGALSVQNLSNAVGWHLELTRQFSGAHLERLQFLGEMLTGMDRDYRHDKTSSMIVNYFHVHWPARIFGPLEAYPPLVVNSDAVLALAVPRQQFKQGA